MVLYIPDEPEKPRAVEDDDEFLQELIRCMTEPIEDDEPHGTM